MANFVNLTPHDIVVRDAMDEDLVIKPSGIVARLDMEETPCGSINGITVINRTARQAINLPEPAPDTFYVVSSMVLDAIDRPDLVAPDTGPTAIRDQKGFIQAVTRLIGRKC